MNSNVAGRDHVAVYVERQVIEWCKEIFGLPAGASGLLTSGTSMGTVIALAAARHAKAPDAQCHGIAAAPRLVGYASREAHGANTKAFELLGLGADALRLVPVDVYCRMLPGRLAEMIAADRAQGFTPAFVIASAGTVNSGAIDDLAAIGAIARAQNLWFHVDGAFGGLAHMVPELRHRLAGIERADSIAFDFHKWLQVPYDAGCVLVRDGELHRRVFSTRREYLAPAGAALGGGDPWFCEYGPEMSRGFRALKVWFTLKAYGTERLAEVIARNCRQAAFLGDEIGASKELELVAPVSLNIACFRYVADGVDDRALDTLNADIVAELQSSGIAAPSTTRLDGKTAIRVCLTNHRTQSEDLIVLLRAVETIGRVRSAVLRPRRRA